MSYARDPRLRHGLYMMGRVDEATQYLMRFDGTADFEVLASLLLYPHFDPRSFPKFMARMQGQGLEDRVVLDFVLPDHARPVARETRSLLTEDGSPHPAGLRSQGGYHSGSQIL